MITTMFHISFPFSWRNLASDAKFATDMKHCICQFLSKFSDFNVEINRSQWKCFFFLISIQYMHGSRGELVMLVLKSKGLACMAIQQKDSSFIQQMNKTNTNSLDAVPIVMRHFFKSTWSMKHQQGHFKDYVYWVM